MHPYRRGAPAKGDSTVYDGPIIDVFFHPPWPKQSESDSWGTRQAWIDDPRRARVMRTFHQSGDAARTPDKTIDEMVRDMEEARIEKAIFQSSAYYPLSRSAVEKKHRELYDVLGSVDKEHRRLLLTATIVPPEQGPGTTWDVMANAKLLEQAHRDYGVVGVHMLPSPWGTPPNHKWFYPCTRSAWNLALPSSAMWECPGRCGRWSRTTPCILTK